MAFLRAFPGWTQVDSYRDGRSSRAERGVVHTAQLGANDLHRAEIPAA